MKTFTVEEFTQLEPDDQRLVAAALILTDHQLHEEVHGFSSVGMEGVEVVPLGPCLKDRNLGHLIPEDPIDRLAAAGLAFGAIAAAAIRANWAQPDEIMDSMERANGGES